MESHKIGWFFTDISFNKMSSRLIHVESYIRIWFLFKTEQHFVYSSIDVHLGSFHLLPIVNNTAMNMNIQLSVQISDLSSFEYIPKSEFGRLYGYSMLNFLRNYHTIFYRGYAILLSCQKYTRFLVSPRWLETFDFYNFTLSRKPTLTIAHY